MEIYKDFLDASYTDKIEEEMENEQEIIYHKFYELEDGILRMLSDTTKINSDIKKINKEKNINFCDLKEKEEILEKEYKEIKDEYNKELSNYKDNIEKLKGNQKEIEEWIKDLYIEMSQNLSIEQFFNIKSSNCQKVLDSLFGKNVFNVREINENINNNNSIVNKNYYGEDLNFYYEKLKEKINIDISLREIKILIIDCEKIVSGFLNKLERYENDDRKCYEELINKKKNDFRNRKQNQNKTEVENEKISLKKKKNSMKIIFRNRKTEAPFRAQKKVEKVTIDPEIIRQMENEELLTYK